MTATAYPRVHACVESTLRLSALPYDGTDLTSTAHAKRLQQLLQAAAKCGMFYTSAGVPATLDSGEAAPTGAFCVDTTNSDVYVCTGSTRGAWVKLATGT